MGYAAESICGGGVGRVVDLSFTLPLCGAGHGIGAQRALFKAILSFRLRLHSGLRQGGSAFRRGCLRPGWKPGPSGLWFSWGGLLASCEPAHRMKPRCMRHPEMSGPPAGRGRRLGRGDGGNN